ncbi:MULTISPECIES: hypothetical protein [unclassified Ruegeria]|uniref:hypothetical protein n=1 Tax=unclassified Ruegeria TaxID=2625375 RepID=UPI001492F12F|nr:MULTISPECIES: hypothetical protein [unclassified Ruegeria]NOD35687.1 hypothetical protein [Ruegeria sp. HKCCD7296]NOE43054.1 hypothetical protein [Ruegeria sp. HKCCD7319]
MNTGEELRQIIERLQHLKGSPGYRLTDPEAKRRFDIDLQTGHALARQVLRRARAGLALWDAGDRDGAQGMLDEVLGAMAYLRRAGVDLDKPPVYGRNSSDRNARFARLVDAKREATGQIIEVCIDAVMLENPDLARLFATRNPASLKKAYQRGQKA